MGISNFKFQISNAHLIILLLLILVLLVLGVQIKVNKISCQTQYGPCSDSYRGRLSDFSGRQILSVTSSEIKKSLSAVGMVGKVAVIKYLTGRLEVNIEVEKPRVAVQLGDDASKLWLVALDGKIVAQTNQTSMPKMIVRSGKISRDDQNFVSAVRLTELAARARKIDHAELSGENLTIYTEGTEVIMPLVGREAQVLVGSLQLILERGTISGKRPVKIDLRFKNAVITY